jgi:hypothetical protein
MQGHLKINIDLFSALCPPQLHKSLKANRPRNFISDFRLQAFLSAVCEHDVQSFTVARWKDFLTHSEYKEQLSVKYKKYLDNKLFTLSLNSISFWQK